MLRNFDSDSFLNIIAFLEIVKLLFIVSVSKENSVFEKHCLLTPVEQLPEKRDIENCNIDCTNIYKREHIINRVF